jgi:hypothetical protein
VDDSRWSITIARGEPKPKVGAVVIELEAANILQEADEQCHPNVDGLLTPVNPGVSGDRRLVLDSAPSKMSSI